MKRRLTVRRALERPGLLEEALERQQERELARYEAEMEAREARVDPDYGQWLTSIEPEEEQ